VTGKNVIASGARQIQLVLQQIKKRQVSLPLLETL
jgi:hypothetical protein